MISKTPEDFDEIRFTIPFVGLYSVGLHTGNGSLRESIPCRSQYRKQLNGNNEAVATHALDGKKMYRKRDTSHSIFYVHSALTKDNTKNEETKIIINETQSPNQNKTNSMSRECVCGFVVVINWQWVSWASSKHSECQKYSRVQFYCLCWWRW